LSGVNGEAASATQRVESQKNQGHQNAVQIEHREYTPNDRRVTPGIWVNASIELAIQGM
jgi:hypothetical protein